MDSCASYHTFFVKEFLKNIQEGGATMTGRCNAGTTSTSKRGSYGDFKVWLNEKCIANLISIPMLEASGYVISTHTQGEWRVFPPAGHTIPFKRDTGLCAGMPYIDLCKHKQGLVMIETICKNMTGFTPQEIAKAKLSRQTQGRVGHPPDGVFK